MFWIPDKLLIFAPSNFYQLSVTKWLKNEGYSSLAQLVRALDC